MGISSKLSLSACAGTWGQVIRRVHKSLPRAFPGALQLKVDFGLVPSIQLFECHSFPPWNSTRRVKKNQNPTYFFEDRERREETKMRPVLFWCLILLLLNIYNQLEFHISIG